MSDATTTPGVRWWPVVAILAMAAIAVVCIHKLMPVDGDLAYKTIFQAIAIFIASLLLLAWLAFFSRLRRKVRVVTVAALAVTAGVFAVSMRIRGYQGGLVPLLEYRWRVQQRLVVEDDDPVTLLASGMTDFPQFLGPTRDGMLPDLGLSFDWENNPPELLWRRDIGPGWSSFAVVGDFAFTQQQDGDEETVVCVELQTGKVRWRTAEATRYGAGNEFGGVGPRSTPTVYQGRVYSVGATGLLNCLDASDGQRLWSKDLLADNGAKNVQWGFCCSPLLVDDKVIVSAGGPDGKSLVAYHKDDGRKLWSGGDDRASYSSPLLATIAGQRQVLIVNANSIASHHVETGELLWHFKRPGGMPSVSQPVPLSGDRVFICKGYGEGCAMLQISRDGDAWSVKKLWDSRRLKPKFSNVVVRDGFAFGLDNVLLTCLDIRPGNSGSRQWAERGFDYGQVLLVGDVLLVQQESGTLVAVRATPDGYEELGRHRVLGAHTWNSPVLAGQYYLVRNDREAACYKLPLRRNPTRERGM